MPHKVTVQPTIEPISLVEAKGWLKVHPTVTEDDNLIRSLIVSARAWAQHGSGQALMEQTIEEVWDHFPSNRIFELAIPPLISVTKVEYLDENGAYQTWPSTNYTADTFSTPARVVVKNTVSQPTTYQQELQYPNNWKITYKAGKATPLAVDGNIKTAMLLQLTMMYENREDIPLGKSNANPLARSAYNLLAISRVSLL